MVRGQGRVCCAMDCSTAAKPTAYSLLAISTIGVDDDAWLCMVPERSATAAGARPRGLSGGMRRGRAAVFSVFPC